MAMHTSNDLPHNSPANRDLTAPASAPDNPPEPPPEAQQSSLKLPSEPLPPDLPEDQRQALEWLNTEKHATVGDAAEFAGVSRATFYRWVDNDPAFRVLYLTWLQTRQRIGDGQVFASELAAVDALCDAARHGNDLSAARFVAQQAIARRQVYQRQLQHRERLRQRAVERAQQRDDRLREQAQRREDRARELAQRREERAQDKAQRREDHAREIAQRRDDRAKELEQRRKERAHEIAVRRQDRAQELKRQEELNDPLRGL
jgi:hypothetical protein